MVKGAMKVRTRAESILDICDDLLGDLSDEASHIEGEAGAKPAQDGGSASPAAD